MLTDSEIDKILNFLDQYGKFILVYKDDIIKHEEYGTHEVVWKNGEIIAYSRWNVEGDTAHIIEAVVAPWYRFKRLLKLMLCRGLRRFPVKYIKYEREWKARKEMRIVSVDDFLNIKETRWAAVQEKS
jgi:hypothetical protein